jgi:hypothetical protein
LATVGSFGRGWVVARLTVRYLLSTKRGIATLALAWVPLLLTGFLALAKAPSFDILLFQILMILLFLQVVLIFVTLLSRPVSKPAIAVSKYAGYLVAVLVLLVPPVVLAYAVTEAYAGTALGTDLDVLGGFLAATVLGSVAYGALFFFLSVVLRKPLAVGLLIGFVWESIVGSIPGDVPKLSIIFYLRSILKGMISIVPLARSPTDVSAEVAAVVLVAFSVAILVLAVVVFQGMEFRQKA